MPAAEGDVPQPVREALILRCDGKRPDGMRIFKGIFNPLGAVIEHLALIRRIVQKKNFRGGQNPHPLIGSQQGNVEFTPVNVGLGKAVQTESILALPQRVPDGLRILHLHDGPVIQADRCVFPAGFEKIDLSRGRTFCFVFQCDPVRRGDPRLPQHFFGQRLVGCDKHGVCPAACVGQA